MTDKHNIAEIVRDLTVQASEPFNADNDHGLVRILPEGAREISTEKFQSFPNRIRRWVRLETIKAMADYHKRFANEQTCCYVSRRSETIVMVIDEPSLEVAAWEDHGARLPLENSQEWHAWRANDRRDLSQIEFAEFLEDHLEDLASHGDVVFDAVTAFQVKRDEKFKSAIDLGTGEIEFSYERHNQPTSPVSLPRKISLGIPIYDASAEALKFDVRLKYRQRDGVLKFRYEIVRPERVIEEAFRSIEDELASHDIDHVRGSPTS